MIHHVSSFHDLLNFRYADGINAACWPTTLPGDYAEVVRLLGPGTGIVALDEDRLMSLEHGAGSREAVKHMLSDLKLLRDAGRDPVLNIVYGYEKDSDPICPTDVFSWHVDSAPIESDTWLCTYHGAPSEGLLNEHALRKVDDPELRARLLTVYGGRDDQDFTAWLTDNHYDLHYSPALGLPKGSAGYSFGLQSLWRIACAWPDSSVPPCVHRAPRAHVPRLLLIS